MQDVEIHYLTKKRYFEVIKHNPYIHKIHLFENNYKSLINNLKSESFDYIIDLHRNARSFRVKNNLKSLSLSFNKLNFQKWLLVNFKINNLPDIHIVDRYFKTLEPFEIKNDNQGLNFFFDEKTIEQNIEKSDFPEKEFVAFAIGAKHATKRLPNDKIIELCNKLECPVVLLGDKHDFSNGENIKKSSGNIVYNACGKFNLNESIYILKHSKLVITHDTGLMHIASALHKKIISVWGNTVPEFGMYPYMPDSTDTYSIVEVKNLKCRPCSKIGFDKCPKKHFKCMNDIDVDSVVKIAKSYLRVCP